MRPDCWLARHVTEVAPVAACTRLGSTDSPNSLRQRSRAKTVSGSVQMSPRNASGTHCRTTGPPAPQRSATRYCRPTPQNESPASATADRGAANAASVARAAGTSVERDDILVWFGPCKGRVESKYEYRVVLRCRVTVCREQCSRSSPLFDQHDKGDSARQGAVRSITTVIAQLKRQPT